MIYTILAVFTAALIAFGRQASVILKFKPGLWFFRYFERKRIAFTLIAALFLVLGLTASTDLAIKIISSAVWGMLIAFSFFFDMKYFFPEIISTEKQDFKDTDKPNDTEIFGVVVGAEKIAYGLDEILIPFHLIHDNVGGEEVLISYCAMCKSALAFNRKLEAEVLNFRVAGVWRRNMIIVDDKTESIWQQTTGECIFGPLKGKKLEMIHSENTVLQKWVEKYPQSKLVFEGKNARRGFFPKRFMLRGLKFVPTKVLMPGFSDISQLPAREIVFGIDYRGEKVAYPIAKLQNHNEFKDEIGGKKIHLKYDQKSNSLSAVDIESGEEISVQKHWWLGWKEFYPETRVW
jgi:hypothetical protein